MQNLANRPSSEQHVYVKELWLSLGSFSAVFDILVTDPNADRLLLALDDLRLVLRLLPPRDTACWRRIAANSLAARVNS